MRFDIAQRLRDRSWQTVAVVLTVLFVGALHVRNDGLWFQGDSPRHAMNGLFWWDYVRALPANPAMFAVRYYARYPTVTPATYPPGFYLIEGLAFQVFGASSHLAKWMVLAFAAIGGLYTAAWSRRWIAPAAGWTGAFFVLLPGIVLWSNAVMLNIPAMALGLASLFHFRRWLEASERKQLAWTVLWLTAALLTYFQAISVVVVCVAWLTVLRRRTRLPWQGAWLLGAIAIAALVPLAVAAYLAPAQLTRNLPNLDRLLTARTWTFYWAALPQIVGLPVLILGAAGAVAAMAAGRWRTELAWVAVWFAALMLFFTCLPARDSRYILLAAPAVVIAAAIGLASVAERLPVVRGSWQVAALAAGLVASLWSATRVSIPQVAGFREVAEYLKTQAPDDAVLYDGFHDGVFGFYVRALDPGFERRMVRGEKLLYDYSPRTTFRWIESSHASTTDEVLNLVRARSGCRWVAIEVGPTSERIPAQRLLRRAVEGPGFTLVRSFPVAASGAARVDLYAVNEPGAPMATVDLSFPAFSTRTFTHVVPITR